MFDHLLAIGQFMLNAFLHVWPYLLITIPLAVAVQMSGASKYIQRAFAAQPIIAIFLATAVGAFSPFCSCGVIPVVASLLIGGVPLAPVMSFWIASPSMDPEVFFLSVATIGGELAVWRLGSTLLLSLSAGFVTHFMVQRGWLGTEILRRRQSTSIQSNWALLKQGWQNLKHRLTFSPVLGITGGQPTLAGEASCCGSTAEITLTGDWQPASPAPASSSCGSSGCGASSAPAAKSSCSLKPASFRQRLLAEAGSAALMVAKFMALAFLLEALITLYVPSEWIAGLLGQQNQWAILMAALIGVPVYTTELTALPLMNGLLAQGMNPAAALAFLIAGPTTTLPAMAAVWGLTTRRIFFLYISFVLVGAIVFGYAYSLVHL
ncbi:MAG: permease [Anaerolineae bacterium]|nr:permease [Anaerolineae bacterium]